MSLAVCVGLAAKEQYMRTLQSAILKGKNCERRKSNLTYTGTLAVPALGHTPSVLLSLSFPFSPFCYNLPSFPFLILHLTHLHPLSFTLFLQDGFPSVCSPPGLLGPSVRARPKQAPAALQQAHPRELGLQSLEEHS